LSDFVIGFGYGGGAGEIALGNGLSVAGDFIDGA
jgi:hypothetical protein